MRPRRGSGNESSASWTTTPKGGVSGSLAYARRASPGERSIIFGARLRASSRAATAQTEQQQRERERQTTRAAAMRAAAAAPVVLTEAGRQRPIVARALGLGPRAAQGSVAQIGRASCREGG